MIREGTSQEMWNGAPSALADLGTSHARNGSGGAILQIRNQATGKTMERIDPRVVRRAQRGDRECSEAVVEHCRGMFKAHLQRSKIFGEDRDDLLQSGLIEISRQLGRYEGRAALETWALTVFRCIIHRHFTGREDPAATAVALGSSGDDEDDRSDDIPATTQGAESEALGRFFMDAVRDCLARIPLGMRMVCTLRWFRHLEQHEIAEELGLVIGTVQSRLGRGTPRVRQCLESKGYTAEVLGVA
jgi:RNA polymerase sigma-70 factor, ECF subfamily